MPRGSIRPPNAGKGRPKGSKNRQPLLLKEMVAEALEGAGGAAYLQRQAEENPSAFMALLGKLLPLQVQGDPNAPIAVTLITRRIVDPARPDDRAGA